MGKHTQTSNKLSETKEFYDIFIGLIKVSSFDGLVKIP